MNLATNLPIANTTSAVKVKSVNKKWIPQIQLSAAALQLNILEALQIINYYDSDAQGITAANPQKDLGIAVGALAKNAAHYNASILWTRTNNKKSQFMLGFNVNYTSYNYYLFSAGYLSSSYSSLNGGTGVEGLNGAVRSFSTRPSLVENDQLQLLKNQAIGIGVPIGAKFLAKQLTKGRSLQLQTLLTPYLFVAKNIYLNELAKGHFFKNDVQLKEFQISQQFSILYETYLGLRKCSIGPVVQWNFTKLNKSSSALQNIHWASFGVQASWELFKGKN
jgi:hypothetical protein